MFREFVRNPFQKKFLPVLAALLQIPVFTPITHKATSVIVPLMLALIQVATTGRTIKSPWKWGYIGWAAISSAIAVMMVFNGALLAAAVAGVWALYPLTVLFTQPVE